MLTVWDIVCSHLGVTHMKAFIKKVLLLHLFCLHLAFFGFAFTSSALPTTSHSIIGDVMTYDIIIDVGHGGVDGGANINTILEKQLNLEIGTQLFEHLQQKNYQVGMTRIHDYALSDDYTSDKYLTRHRRDLRQRKLIADEINPHMFISVHMNMVNSHSVKGPTILYRDQAESYLLAQLLQQELNQLANVQRRSVQTNYYYLLKSVKPATIIAEIGFISHPQERALLMDSNYQKQIVQHIGQAIDHYFTLYPT